MSFICMKCTMTDEQIFLEPEKNVEIHTSEKEKKNRTEIYFLFKRVCCIVCVCGEVTYMIICTYNTRITHYAFKVNR